MTLWRRIAPEIVAAASDNDPTNLGTAAYVGVQSGYQLSWVALLVAPLLWVTQLIAAELGAVARNDLVSLTVKRYGHKMAFLLTSTVVVVNLATIAADLDAGAAGLGLLIRIDSRYLVVPLALVLGSFLVFVRYERLIGLVRYLLVGFFAFAVSALLARPHWTVLLRGSLVPMLSLARPGLTGALALLGTTISSYAYVWETIQRGLEARVSVNSSSARTLRIGSAVGAVFTAFILWCMLVATAATLGRQHVSAVTAENAAVSLRPLAGSAATELFALGLLISALVALPVLIATTAHAVGASFDWRRGLREGMRAAPRFYAVLVGAVVLAVAVDLAQVSVIIMLVAASVLSGLATPFGVVLLVRLARDQTVMGNRRISLRLAAGGWIVASAITVLSLALIGATLANL